MLKPSDRVADDLEQLLLKLIGDWYLLLQAKSVDRHQWRHIEGWMLSTPVRLNSGFKHIDDYRRTGKTKAWKTCTGYWMVCGCPF